MAERLGRKSLRFLTTGRGQVFILPTGLFPSFERRFEHGLPNVDILFGEMKTIVHRDKCLRVDVFGKGLADVVGGILEKFESRVFPKERRSGRPQTIFGIVRVGKTVENAAAASICSADHSTFRISKSRPSIKPRDRHGDGLGVGIVLRF